MSRNPFADIQVVYLEEVLKPQLGKSTSGGNTQSGGDQKSPSVGGAPSSELENKKRVRQAAYDIRQEAKKRRIPVEVAFNEYIRNSKMSPREKALLRSMLGFGPAPVSASVNEAKVPHFLVARTKRGSKPEQHISSFSYADPNAIQRRREFEKQGWKTYITSQKPSDRPHDPAYSNRRDQNKDGDNDFADVMSARMQASGMSRDKANAAVENKPYNKKPGLKKSNWRKELKEVVDDEVITQQKNQIKEKKINNSVKINPNLEETAKKLGGNLVNVTQLKESDEFECILSGLHNAELYFIDDNLIECAILEFFCEALEDGYEIEYIQESILNSVDTSLQLISEATVTTGHDTKRQGILGKIKKFVKRVGKKLARGAGYTAGVARRAAGSSWREAEKGYARGRYGSSYDDDDDEDESSGSKKVTAGKGASEPRTRKKVEVTVGKGKTDDTESTPKSKVTKSVSDSIKNGLRKTTYRLKGSELPASHRFHVVSKQKSDETTKKTPKLGLEKLGKGGSSKDVTFSRSMKKRVVPIGSDKKELEGAAADTSIRAARARSGTPEERSSRPRAFKASTRKVTPEITSSTTKVKRKGKKRITFDSPELDNLIQSVRANEDFNYLSEKAESKQQQKIFGLALSVKRGETPRSEVSSQVLKIVDSMSETEIRKFAKTKHKGIPQKVDEAVARVRVRRQSPNTQKGQNMAQRTRLLNQRQRLVPEDFEVNTMSPQELRLQRQKAALEKRIADQRGKTVRTISQPRTMQNASYEPEGEMIDERARARKGQPRPALDKVMIDVRNRNKEGFMTRSGGTVSRHEKGRGVPGRYEPPAPKPTTPAQRLAQKKAKGTESFPNDVYSKDGLGGIRGYRSGD